MDEGSKRKEKRQKRGKKIIESYGRGGIVKGEGRGGDDQRRKGAGKEEK